MGCGACMSSAISFSTRFCAPVGLNGSMALIFSRTRSFNSNEMPGCNRALARFSDKPHSSQKNSSKISRQCAGVRKALSRRRSAVRRGEVQRADGGPEIEQFQALAQGRREDDLRAARWIRECDASATGARAW